LCLHLGSLAVLTAQQFRERALPNADVVLRAFRVVGVAPFHDQLAGTGHSQDDHAAVGVLLAFLQLVFVAGLPKPFEDPGVPNLGQREAAEDQILFVDPKGDDYSRYQGANVVTPNRAELREVVGTWKDEADLERRAQALRSKLGLEALLLTRSEQGMTLYRADDVFHVKAEAREVYDVSGAGDTVIAALGVMLAVGANMAEAVRVANRAAGIVVGKLGTAVATREELFGH